MLIKLFKKCLDFCLNVGVSYSDSEAVRLKKVSIAMVPIIIGPAGFIWGLIYFMLGHTLSAAIPFTYFLISVGTLIHFYFNKNIVIIQKTQMLSILLLPFFLMWSLGGFAQSSFVMIWAFFSPLAALIHDKSNRSLYWFYAFIALVIFSTLIDEWLIAHNSIPIPQMAKEILFFLNIAGALAGVYFLIRHFINEKDKNSDTQLKLKQEALIKSTKEHYDNLSYLQSYKDNIDKNLIVTKTDVDGIITFANDNFYAISGYSEKEVIGKTHRIIKHPNNSHSMYEKMWHTILAKKTWHARLKNMAKDGSTYWIDSTVSPILNKDGDIVEFIAIRHDITKLVKHKDELTKMLYVDQLTNLKSRNALIDEVQDPKNKALILINIDHFSQINDLYGTDFGNKVLVEFSKLLERSIDKNVDCSLFRLNGDEFVLLSTESNKNTVIENVNKFIEHLGSNHLTINDAEISLNVTIGISFEENSSLLSTANMAMKIARRETRSFMVYTDKISLNNEYANNIIWIKKVKEAIRDDRITMFFQPIVNNSDPSINKYETLIRLIDTDGKVITPYFFLEIAKKAKLYRELTKIVITKSFEAFKDNTYEFSVNITIDDILDPEISEYIYKSLKEYNIGNRVTFEIVESESIENFEDVEKFIVNVKAMGCKIAIDDFGTGYSNFEHLMKLQADFIKIDGSIIKEIINDKRSELITTVIVAFAKEMNIETIGEYVENEEIYSKLKELGVNNSQGYYFDKPLATFD